MQITICEDEISVTKLESNDFDNFNKLKCIKELMSVFDSFYAKNDRYPKDFNEVIKHFRQNNFFTFEDLVEDYTGKRN